MADMPNPFEFGAEPFAPDDAAASFPQPPADAAADLSYSGVTDCPSDEAAASLRQDDAAVDLIAEIFVGARKLEQLPGIFDQAAYTPADELAYVELKLADDPYTADLIDIPDGLWGEFDPAPLFLQKVG